MAEGATSKVSPEQSLFNESLTTNVVPYELSDVVLFVSQGNRLRTIDAFTGRQETDIGALSGGSNRVLDIAMRSDGQMFGTETQVANPDPANLAGRLVEIDPGNAAQSVLGADGVPNTAVVSDSVNALAYRRTGYSTLRDHPTYELYLAVTPAGGGNSRLYEADLATGSVTASPYGLRHDRRGRTSTGMALRGTVFLLYGVSSAGYFFQIDTINGSTTLLNNLAGAPFSGLTPCAAKPAGRRLPRLVLRHYEQWPAVRA